GIVCEWPRRPTCTVDSAFRAAAGARTYGTYRRTAPPCRGENSCAFRLRRLPGRLSAGRSSSSCTRAVGHRPFRRRERRHEPGGVADVEQHPLRPFAGHPLRLEVDDEQRLAADDLLRVLAFLLHPGEDRSRPIAEADGQTNELARRGHIVDRLNRAHAHVERLDDRERHDGLYGCRDEHIERIEDAIVLTVRPEGRTHRLLLARIGL